MYVYSQLLWTFATVKTIMGISLDQYRRTIGSLNCAKYTSVPVCNSVSCCILVCCVVKLLMVIILLLALCNDIETNPGPNREKYFRIGLWNIRGIRANLSDLRIHLSSLYDIFCVSETMLSENVTNDQLAVNNYQSPIRRDRDHNGGGLLIYLSHKVLANCRVT